MSDPETHVLNSQMLCLTWQLRQQAKHAFDTLDLLFDEGMILVLLRTGIDRPGELAINLSLKRTTISKRLSELETQGLIERHKAFGSEDRRGVRLKLTPKGKKTGRALLESWREGVQHDLRLTDKEHQVFERWCRNLLGSST